MGALTGEWVDVVKNPEHTQSNLRISRKYCFGAMPLSKLAYRGSGLVKINRAWIMEKYFSAILVSGMWAKAAVL